MVPPIYHRCVKRDGDGSQFTRNPYVIPGPEITHLFSSTSVLTEDEIGMFENGEPAIASLS